MIDINTESIQLIANVGVLGALGILYSTYITNLNSTISKTEKEVDLVERNLQFWKDKAGELEKKSPDFIVQSLNERVNAVTEEVKRLYDDKTTQKAEIQKKNEELTTLRKELARAEEVKAELMDVVDDYEEDIYEKVGYINVESGQLLITDPEHIDSDWQKTDFEITPPTFRDTVTGAELVFKKDYTKYTDIPDGYTKTIMGLINENRLVPHGEESDSSYSYKGASVTTYNLGGDGYGILNSKNGLQAAGFVTSTLFRSGKYPIYAELYEGKIIKLSMDLTSPETGTDATEDAKRGDSDD